MAMNGEFFLAWLRAGLEAARALPPDALLLVIVIELVLLINFIVSEVNAARRARFFQEENASLAAEVLTARRALDTERRWRLAAEKAVAEAKRPALPELEPEPQPPPQTDIASPPEPVLAQEVAAPAAGPIPEPLPPREILEMENLDPTLPASPPAIAPEDVAAADESTVETPVAPAAARRKAPTAKTKSARRAAKVANLINRTIFE
jgi:hypothetical protein